jgi:regulator of sigma D
MKKMIDKWSEGRCYEKERYKNFKIIEADKQILKKMNEKNKKRFIRKLKPGEILFYDNNCWNCSLS